MLTKDLLKFHRRAGVIKPVFLDPSDDKVHSVAEAFLAQFAASEGLRFCELEESISGMHLVTSYAPGFKKLLMDRLEAAQDDGSFSSFRWKCFEVAESLRKNGKIDTPSELFSEVAAKVGTDEESIEGSLYGDLPAERVIESFKGIEKIDLVHRYNCALVQGLLLRSNEIKITIKDLGISAQRQLFLNLRFHRLLCEIQNHNKKKTTELKLSGPLGIFQNAQTYGLRLANFFPHLLNLEKWKLEAGVKIGNRNLVLKLDQKCGIRSHYRSKTPHIPEELLVCLSQFEESLEGVTAKPAATVLHLGSQNIVVPDIEISKGETQVYVELFHKWHGSQIKRRLQMLEESQEMSLVLGVCKTLQKNKEFKEVLQKSEYFSKHGFVFSEFPTAKKLKSAVMKYL